MPLLREICPSGGIRCGIWNITETAGELLDIVHLSASENLLYGTFSHDLRKRQWLAYRALLKQMLDPGSADLGYDLNGKPFLRSGTHHISVSHAGDFAAAAISEDTNVGVDIEKLKVRVERVKDRFMLPGELDSLDPADRLEQLYVYWCGKEALYKLHGNPGLDFQNDIYIHRFDYFCNTNHICKATLTVNGCKKDYTLHYEKNGDYMIVVAY